MFAEDGAEGANKYHVMIVLEYTNTMQTQYCVHVCTSTEHFHQIEYFQLH